MFRLVAQTAAPDRLPWSMFYSALAIMVFLIVGFAVIAIVKRRAEAYKDVGGPVVPFTLHDLRKLHEEGQLTDEEFEKARGRIVAMSKAAMDRKTPVEKRPVAPPDDEKADQA